jgi:O-antigen biosynthesis protein
MNHNYSTHSQIAKLVGKNETVLDAGCNIGYLGKYSDKTNIFYGFDYSSEFVKKTKKSYKEAIVYDLNSNKPLPWKRKFSVIVFADVLEHLHNPREVLIYFKNHYLQKDGRIIISLPNVANWKIRLDLLMGKFEYQESGILDKTHLHLYTFQTATQLIESCDLHIDKIIGGASIFGPIIKLIPILRPLLSTGIIFESKPRC